MVVEEGADRNGSTDERTMQRLSVGSVVHSKSAFSLTASDAAMRALDATERRTAVLVGFETDVCVAQSAVDLLDRGYRRRCRVLGRPHHERGLRRMTQAGAEWNHCKGLVLEWLRTVDFGRRIWNAATERFGPFPTDV